MKDLKSSILMFITFTVICGGVYPLAVTGVAYVLFPREAKGSLMADTSGKVTGSSLLGQPFSSPDYFWPRPSATTDFGYNPMGSGGSNAGPTNPDYLKVVGERVKALRATGITGPIPSELVQASASGLDPHISREAARIQIPRVAQTRGISRQDLSKIVDDFTSDRQLGFLGEPRVNVLELNLKLKSLNQRRSSGGN